MSIPKDHKEIFRSQVEDRIEKNLQSLKDDRRALRLLDKEKTEPVYGVVIVSCWSNKVQDRLYFEKEVFHEQRGKLRDVLKAAKKKFMDINNCKNNNNVHYYIRMQVGNVSEPLPETIR